MNKEEFLKELEMNLKYLSKRERKEELEKYNNLDNYNLEVIEEANKIYKAKGQKIVMTKEIKLYNAVNIIIKNIRLKNKEILTNIILFFLYLLLLVIVIKIPFIYTRDMISNLFNTLFEKEIAYIIWNLLIEFIYAITCILIFIRLIKKKALELEKNVNELVNKK